jgi:hypothetical protein
VADYRDSCRAAQWSARRRLLLLQLLQGTCSRRAEFIRGYQWPRGLYVKLIEKRPGISRKELALVSRGLRQYFLAYLLSGRGYVSMPSQVVDDFWHEFILYTREYEQFCRRAFGGFLHHTPAVALSDNRMSNEGLRRVWSFACREESINPVNPTRLPLLFALDAKLNIKGGFRYHPRCEEKRKERVHADSPARATASAPLHCGGDFSNPAFDGSTAGFSAGPDVSSGAADGDGGGDGGGCGGGGGCSGS